MKQYKVSFYAEVDSDKEKRVRPELELELFGHSILKKNIEGLEDITRFEVKEIDPNEKEEIALGTITVSDKVRVTDPCYKINTWCAYTIENMKAGNYIAKAYVVDHGTWGKRVAELVISREGIRDVLSFEKVEEADIGVDSGMAGFFDYHMFEKESSKTSFRNRWLSIDDNKDGKFGGIIDNYGAVSSAGYGDGSYELYAAYEDGKIIAAKIVFIRDNEEEC